MSEFIVSGRFEARGGHQQFEKTIEAPNEDVATERTYALIGSHHGLKRTQVHVDGVMGA
jgi:large subunit ribosomal protein LX